MREEKFPRPDDEAPMTREGEGRLSLALVLVAGTCIFAFSRVFSGRAWLIPTLASAWAAIALTRWLAHRNVPRPVIAVAVALVGAWFVIVVVFPATTVFGVPTTASLRQVAAAIRAAQALVPSVTAPVPPDPGFLATAMVAAWVAGEVSAALLGAPRRRQRREERSGLAALSSSLLAPAPWIVLFTIAAGVGQGGGRLFDAGLFFASLLLYLLAEGWSSLGVMPKLNGALRLGVLSMIGALSLPFIIPGYRSGPVFPWARIGPLTETTVSPLVQIKPFLLNQSSVKLFNVTADQAAYWRLTSLDHFDGNTWSSQGTYNPAGGTLSTPPPGIDTLAIRQHYAITGLGGIWVPAAYAPTRISGLRTSIDPNSRTLIVSGLHAGNSYDVVSAAPQPTGSQLAGAGATAAPSPEDIRLPSSTIAAIDPIARGIVQPATNPYVQAVALQDYLRKFAYDERVPAGSSDNYLVDFLTKTQRGFCEQFAGSMAVMLRVLGIPARVAVGFLPGQPAPSVGASTYSVTGREAHAWPEAYFSGIGWVAFEPTPRPDAPPPAYTVAPAPNPTPAAPSPTPQASSTAASPTASPRAAERPTPTTRPVRSPVSTARRASNALLLAVAAALVLLFVAREVRLRLPGWLARSPQEKAVTAYQEFLLRAADATQPRNRGETEAEYARSLLSRLSLPAAQVAAITGTYQRAAYSLQAPNELELRAALKANRAMRTQLWKRADWRGKARMAFSPRPLYTRRAYERKAVRAPRSSSAPSAARRV